PFEMPERFELSRAISKSAVFRSIDYRTKVRLLIRALLGLQRAISRLDLNRNRFLIERHRLTVEYVVIRFVGIELERVDIFLIRVVVGRDPAEIFVEPSPQHRNPGERRAEEIDFPRDGHLRFPVK